MENGSSCDILQQIKDNFLVCNICEEPANGNEIELKQLRCQHSLCGNCLNRIIKKKGKAKCPFCRAETPLPENGRFPPCMHAQNLLEFINKLSEEKEHNSDCSTQKITKPVLIRKFKFILPQQVSMCWGKSGQLYTTNYGDNPLKPQGLYCIDVLSGRVKRFGELDSTYDGVLFVDNELFTFNSSRRSIEVYRDEKLLRRGQRCFCMFGELVWMISHPFGGLLMLFKIDTQEAFSLLHTDRNCQTVEIQTHEKPTMSFTKMVINNGVTAVYRGKIWLVSKADDCLYEIPVQQTTNRITYRHAVVHCRLPMNSIVIGQCGKSGIAYKLSNSNIVKVLNLAMLDKPPKLQDSVNKGQRKAQRHSPINTDSHKFTKCSTFLLTDLESNDVEVVASDDGFYAALTDDSTLNIYSTDNTLIESMANENIETQLLTVCKNQSKLSIFCTLLKQILIFLCLAVLIIGLLSIFNYLIPEERRACRTLCEAKLPYWLQHHCKWFAAVEEQRKVCFYLDDAV